MKWAVLGTGKIAHDFVTALFALPSEEIVCVGSRSLERSNEFAAAHNIKTGYGSYEEAVDDPSVDIVYVATSTATHVMLASTALNKKKPVLVEKPLAVNASEAQKLCQVAKDNDTFMMEGVWMHFFPVIRTMQSLLERGDIGEVTSVHASFGWINPTDVNPGVEDVKQGGGGLLAVGIYLIHLALIAFGREKPEKVEAVGELGPLGADVRTTMVMKFSKGRHAMLAVSLRDNYSGDAVIYGTKGKVNIPFPFLCPVSATVEPFEGMGTSIAEPLPSAGEVTDSQGNVISNKFNLVHSAGLAYEGNAVADDVSSGRKESELVPHALSCLVTEIMDTVREKIGLKYPEDGA